MLTAPKNRPFKLLWLSRERSWIRHHIPVLGSIIAGSPEFQEGRLDGCIDIDPSTLRLPHNARTFALKVRGDSMRNAAILEGDIVIMEFREAKHGDIVAALIDGETTLKRFIVQGGVAYLRASIRNIPTLIPRVSWSLKACSLRCCKPSRQTSFIIDNPLRPPFIFSQTCLISVLFGSALDPERVWPTNRQIAF